MVDPPSGVSGAACRTADVKAMLINRYESPGRRAYDMAHELFHLLTWNTMRPPHVAADRSAPPTVVSSPADRKIETTADNFAAGLLMPESAISTVAESQRKDRLEMIVEAALRLGVSPLALKWRLHNRNKRAGFDDVADEALARSFREHVSPSPHPPFLSQTFCERMVEGMVRGQVSKRRVLSMLGLGDEEFSAILIDHGVRDVHERDEDVARDVG